jgi:hypothetical protein
MRSDHDAPTPYEGMTGDLEAYAREEKDKEQPECGRCNSSQRLI